MKIACGSMKRLVCAMSDVPVVETKFIEVEEIFIEVETKFIDVKELDVVDEELRP
jgi:pyruvate formate-lyase activating enzyme-like uncharacterized protein